MCGRYSETIKFEKVAERFGLSQTALKLAPRYNIAPGQDAPVIVNDGGRILKEMRWGLVPSWARDPKIGHKMINARAEIHPWKDKLTK